VEILYIVVKGAIIFVHAAKRRRRGKRASALGHLCGCGLQTLLTGILISLLNKLDKLQLLVGKNRDFFSSSVMCFTETWLCGNVPDAALQLAGFQLSERAVTQLLGIKLQ